MTFDDVKAPLIGAFFLGGALLTPRWFESRRSSYIVSRNSQFKEEFERMYPSVTDASWDRMSGKKKARMNRRVARSLERKGF